jgi:hypothetical protein
MQDISTSKYTGALCTLLFGVLGGRVLVVMGFELETLLGKHPTT